MTSSLPAFDLDALFAAASPDAQDVSQQHAGPAWPSPNEADQHTWASRKPNTGKGLHDVGPLGPTGPHKNEGIDTNTSADALGSGCAELIFRADNSVQKVQRPALHYRLHDACNGAGSIIGAPGDTLGDLLQELRQRYGTRLDLESVREAFEERAAIMEFDAGMCRADAEQSAVQDIRRSVVRS